MVKLRAVIEWVSANRAANGRWYQSVSTLSIPWCSDWSVKPAHWPTTNVATAMPAASDTRLGAGGAASALGTCGDGSLPAAHVPSSPTTTSAATIDQR